MPKTAVPIFALFAIAATLLLPATLRSQEKARTAPPPTYVGLTLANYLVGDEVYQEVYGGAAAMVGLTVSRAFYRIKNFALAAVLDLRRFGRTGASTISQVETRLKLTPASLGVEGSLTRGIFSLWAGGGFDLYFYSEQSSLLNTSGSTSGFHIAGGLALQPLSSWPLRLKLFLRWTKARATENEISAELGGSEYGLALLYGFKLF